MTRLPMVDPSDATGPTKELLDAVRTKLGGVPNMARAMATSPAALAGYLALGDALAGGTLSARLRGRIALTVAEANGCGYCLAAHTAAAGPLGLDEAEVLAARRATSADPKTAEALRFARALVARRGHADDQAIQRLRDAGYGDGQIVELIAEVALHTLTNYVNVAARTDLDFPAVRALVAPAA